MTRHALLPLLLPVLLGACASTPGRTPAIVAETTAPAARTQDEPSRRAPELRWLPGQPLMHGFFGVTAFEHAEVDGSGVVVDGDDGELDSLPLLGGGAQWKMGGERIDVGLEGLLSFGWRGDAEAFVIGGGGAAVAVDVDLLLFELYGGPFASMMLGERLRLYGAAGPLTQFADYSQSGGGLSDDGSGSGAGWYARTGLEFVLPSRVLIGFGVRWSESRVDLDSGLGDLELEGRQAMLTVSRGI